MTQVIGREKEKKKLDQILGSNESEFVAVFGRRRVGKTHLIREYCSPKGTYFEVTGEKDGRLHEQLDRFARTLSQTFLKGAPVGQLKSWRDAMDLLATELERRSSTKPVILFFDELPWLASRRSRFVQALDYFWNQRIEKLPNVKLIVCGSAASWMLNQLINAKGGLHNRLTQIIHLDPFTLAETHLFLKSRNIRLTQTQVLELYMVMGGIPHYLKHVEKGKTATQVINALCFSKQGILSHEFKRLFRSLFDEADLNMTIVRQISTKRFGISRNELLAALDLPSGGTFDKRIEELEASGFIHSFLPFGKKQKGIVYRLVDEYVTFYLKWIEPMEKQLGKSPAIRATTQKSPAWISWSGYAFEQVCFKHLTQIQRALGLGNIPCTASTWSYTAKRADESGAQVDLLFDRDDGAINLCEIKFNSKPYTITKAYASDLMRKTSIFSEKTKTSKQVFLSFVSSAGLKANVWSDELIDGQQATLSDLFQ